MVLQFVLNLDVFMFLFTIRCKGFYLYYAQNNINNNKADFLMIHMRSETVEWNCFGHRKKQRVSRDGVRGAGRENKG